MYVIEGDTMKSLCLLALVTMCLTASVAFAGSDHDATKFGRHLAEQDANHDGKLTLAEMKAAAEALFKRMDANKDGSVVPAEARAAVKAIHAERKDKKHAAHH